MAQTTVKPSFGLSSFSPCNFSPFSLCRRRVSWFAFVFVVFCKYLYVIKIIKMEIKNRLTRGARDTSATRLEHSA
jgi:hypothetical protein